MPRLSVRSETFPIAGMFTISRGSKTEAHVLTAVIHEGGMEGRGECVPYARYGETIDSVRAEIEAAGGAIADGATRRDLLNLMRPGAARNAVDCALWDLEAKKAGHTVAALMGLGVPAPVQTAERFELSQAGLNTPPLANRFDDLHGNLHAPTRLSPCWQQPSLR